MVRNDRGDRRRAHQGIPGLRTAIEAAREVEMNAANRIIVKIHFDVADEMLFAVNETSYVVTGGMTVGNLRGLVSNKVQERFIRPVQFTVEGKQIADGEEFSYIYRRFMCLDGFITLKCTTERIQGLAAGDDGGLAAGEVVGQPAGEAGGFVGGVAEEGLDL